jgi:hypothetical protein
MDTPATIQEPKKGKASFFWSFTAFGISVFALLCVGYVLREFYLDTASIAAGTEVRPMGVTFQLGIAGTASIFFGGICAFIGGIIALIERRWRLVFLAFLAGVATLIPMFAGSRGFDYVVEVRKLVLEP